MAGSSSTYWLSHNTHHGLGVSGPAPLRPGDVQYRIRMVSVVLDWEARFRFAAIRVLVISRLASVTITECADPLRDLGFPQKDDPGYRCRLARRRVSRNESRKTMLGAEMQALQTCTIILELVVGTDTNCEWWYRSGVQLIPRPDVSNPSEFIILYDHIQKCTPDNPSVVLFLESNRLFRPLHGTSYLYNLGHPGVSALTIRVVPTDAQNRPSIHLPPHIVTRIAEFCIGIRASPWRSELLSYGLVCKGWAHVLDLFFQSFTLTPGKNYNRDPPDLHRVARCIEARPERAALIHHFSDDDYTQERHRFSVDDWRQLTSISKRLSVTNLRGVVLGCVPACVAHELAIGLAKLRNVRCLTLGDQRAGKPPPSAYDIETVQAIIENWRGLRKVNLMNWARVAQTPSSSSRTLSAPLHSRIEELQLGCGFLTASQLARFTPPHNPCLRLLRLHRIEGLSNSGLASFLSIVVSSLVILEIYHCQFTHSSDGGDEEFAIDSLMPKFKSLRRLVVNGPNIITSLSLSRKNMAMVTQQQQHQQQGSRTIGQRCAIVVSDATEEMQLEETAKAMEITGWSSVSIHWRNMDQTRAGPYVLSALKTANRRGIDLCYSAGGLGISFGTNVTV